jgi:acylphosphatase
LKGTKVPFEPPFLFDFFLLFIFGFYNPLLSFPSIPITMVRLHIHVSGDVQGVFFRAGAQSEARRLGLSGYARNMDDGSVEVLAEGAKSALDELLEWCHKGPAGASVSEVKFEWMEATGEFKGFRIRYDSE